MEEEHKDISYKNITKATAIFGGTQVMSIAANIVKGKLAACIVGAYGLGISAHLYSTASPIQQLFTCGLNVSAIKALSSAHSEDERSECITCLRRLITLLASMALLCTVASAWWLSQLTFGSQSHWAWFCSVAIAVFFLILASGETTILQGFRELKALATCNLITPVSGLFIAIPLYWLWGIEGIAPSIAAMGIAAWAAAKFFTGRLHLKHSKQTWRETLRQGKSTLIMGASIMGSNMAGALAGYIINTGIGQMGTETDIGFYQAMTNITLQCTSMVFAAMAADYFPHLASITRQKAQATELVCKEGEIALLIIAPITLTLITAAPAAIRILLTAEFDTALFLLRAMSLCLISRAICFPLDYICIAHGDNRFFLLVEGGWSNIKTILFVLCGYAIARLDGIAIALCICAFLDVFISIAINRWRYGIRYSADYCKMAGGLTAAALACFLAGLWTDTVISYSLMSVLTLSTWVYSYKQIDRRIDIKCIIKNKLHGKR